MKVYVTSSFGRLGWLGIGVLAGAIGVLSWGATTPITYPEIIVPAARIIEREVPSGPPKIIERIRYVYLTPNVRAVAPGAVKLDVSAFCRPVMLSATDTVRVAAPLVIRSVVHNPSLVPLVKDRLFVSSMDGYGDLVGEDFRVRPGFGIAAGLEAPFNTTVRYSRFAPFREIGEALLSYGAFRLVEAVVR